MDSQDATFWQNAGLIIGTILLITIGLAVINFMRREAKGNLETEDDLLLPLQQAYKAGQMDSAEFQRIRESIDRQRTGQNLNPPLQRPSPPESTETATPIQPD
ncbi:MAG: hypothetical protein ABI453_05020 [Isosphaeraceae bacterium]